MGPVKFDSTFSDIVVTNYIEAANSPDAMRYSIEVDGNGEDGFNLPPVLLCQRFMSKIQKGTAEDDLDLLDLILHHCVLKVKVVIKADDIVLGSFIANSLSDNWESLCPAFKEHLTAFAVFSNAAQYSIIKKSTLRLRPTAQAIAATTQAQPGVP